VIRERPHLRVRRHLKRYKPNSKLKCGSIGWELAHCVHKRLPDLALERIGPMRWDSIRHGFDVLWRKAFFTRIHLEHPPRAGIRLKKCCIDPDFGRFTRARKHGRILNERVPPGRASRNRQYQYHRSDAHRCLCAV
jgi:hypothetical protein